MNSTPSPDDKDAVIATIVGQMRQHDISPSELVQAFGAGDGQPAEKMSKSDIATRLFSILGGIFIFAGIGTYISMFWDEMNSAMRIIITLGAGLVLHALAVIALHGETYSRSVKPLLLLAAIMQTTGWFVTIYELFPHGNDARYAVLFVMGIMAFQQTVTFLKYRETILLLFSLVFAYAFLFTFLDLVRADRTLCIIGVGISMIALAQAIRPTIHGVLAGIGYFIGACLFSAGAFDWLRGTFFEVVYLALMAGLMYMSTSVRSSALLTVSTVSILGYIGYFTAQHFVNSVGWPVSLIILGAIFFAISRFAIKVKRQYL